MDKNPKAVEKTGEEETPVSTSPVEEQKTTPEVTSEIPETAEKPEETPEEAQVTESGTEVEPKTDEKSEQGKAFAKMRAEIKELKDRLEDTKSRQTSFDAIRNFVSPSPSQQVDPNQFYDTAGNFNKLAYDQARYQADQYNATLARQQAAETVEYKLDEYKARQKYPSLSTNRKFERAVAAEYQTRLLETLGNPNAPQPRIENIADEYAPFFATDQKKVVQKVTTEVKQQLSEKEQASLSASGRSQPLPTNDLENLRARSRQGDKDAIVERLRRLR